MRFLRPLLHFSILAIVAFGILSLMTHLMVRGRADRMADRARTWGYCWGELLGGPDYLDLRYSLKP
jgi:hypothetical protein